MKISHSARLVSTIALLAALGACQTREEAKQATAANQAQAEAYMQVRDSVQPHRGPVNVRIKDGIWLGDAGVRSGNGEPLPARVEGPNAVTLVSARPLQLTEIASRITELTGIQIRDAEFAITHGETRSQSQSTDARPAIPGQPAIRPIGMPGALAADPFAVDDQPVADNRMELNWNGSLSGLLNLVAARFDLEWTYNSGVVRFVGAQTKTFTLNAMPLETETRSEITAGTVSGSSDAAVSQSGTNGPTASSASSAQGTKTKITLKYWDNVKATIENMLPKNAPMSIQRETGTITVTARPSVLRVVENYIREENRRLSRQVAISVKVLSVDVDASDAYNFDLSAILSLPGYGFGLKSAAPLAIEGAASLSGAILPSSRWISEKFTGTNPATGNAEQTKGVIQALSQKGAVSLVTSSSVTTLNNQPAPISVLSQTNFVNRTRSTLTQTGSATEVETSTINAGFNMSVLPRIFSNGDITLTYNITLSELVRMTSFTSGTSTVQLPEVASRSLIQNVRMKSGDTLVLAGFERAANQLRDQGTGTPSNWLFGGGSTAKTRKEVIVLLINVTALEEPAALKVAR